jgi:HD-like signal output (HDOD) protein
MADDPFANRRFKPAAGRPSAAQEDDSGEKHRTKGLATVQIGETELLAEVDRLPSLPKVVNEIMARVGNQQTGAADFEKLIQQDMVIAGRLLKMVNSPFYGMSHPISSITQAVAIAGFSSLRSLVLAASASNLLLLDLGAYGFAKEGLWRNSMATASLAKSIAIRTGVGKDDAEEIFSAALLRDVGMLVLGPIMARHGITLRRSSGQPEDILQRERQVIGFDHSWVGERVADKWKLPANLALAIGKHHRIPAHAEAKVLRHLATVRLAERLAYSAGAGVVADHPFDGRVDGVLVQTAGFDAPGFAALMAEVPRIVSDAERSLA